MEKITLNQIFETSLTAQTPSEVVLSANGSSMFPTIVKGDRIHARIGPLKSPLRVGEIVIAKDLGGRFLIHRVVQTSPQLLTRGDAKSDIDTPIDVVFGNVQTIEKTLRSRLRRIWIHLGLFWEKFK